MPNPFHWPLKSRKLKLQQIGYTFLPCVLAGLSKAPQFVSRGQRGGAGTVWANDADCVVVPANACGGEGTLALCRMSGRKVLYLILCRLLSSPLYVNSYQLGKCRGL